MKEGEPFPATLLRALRRTRYKPLLIVTALCLLVQEQYPFSDFPMYASIGPTSSYLYLADGEGAPVATLRTIGMTAPKLKKVYSSALQKEAERLHARVKELTPEQTATVGEALLRELKEAPRARARGRTAPPVLRLYEVRISLHGGSYERATAMLAEAR